MIKFVADSTLGKLARWLKIAGFDVVYQKNSSPHSVLETAERDDRAILTRNTRISYKKMLFIESDFPWEQLEQVMKAYGAPPCDKAFTRCLECNRELAAISKKAVEGRVPPYVFEVHNDFSICPSCGKIFWAGSHYRRMRRILTRFRKNL